MEILDAPAGEAAAIVLAVKVHADLNLMDNCDCVLVARSKLSG